MTGPLTPDERRHLSALAELRDAGFTFRHFKHGEETVIVYGERRGPGVVESVTVRSATEAVACRTRADDYPTGDPLWQEIGPVHDVVHALLELPQHGSPGAPLRSRRASSSLWLPGR